MPAPIDLFTKIFTWTGNVAAVPKKYSHFYFGLSCLQNQFSKKIIVN